jgi:hypothetical protein
LDADVTALASEIQAADPGLTREAAEMIARELLAELADYAGGWERSRIETWLELRDYARRWDDDAAAAMAA